MKKSALALACAVSLLGVSAQAATISFSDQTLGAALSGAGSSFTVGAYKITYWYGQSAVFFETNGGAVALGDDQTSGCCGAAFTLSRIDGQAFTLNSVTYGRNGEGSFSARVHPQPYSGGPLAWISTDGQTAVLGTAPFQNQTAIGFDSYASSGSVGLRSLDVTSAADVPEPATWAMMIGGFGLAGFGLRRRKLVAA